MNFLQEPLFKAIFDTPVPRIILKANSPDFTIISYNEAYKEATYTQERDITGLYLWQAFDPGKAGGEGREILLNALLEAAENNKTIHTPPFHYNIPSADGESFVKSWWQLEIVPVNGNGVQPEYLLTTTYNITDKILNQQTVDESLNREQNLTHELEALNEELAATNEELNSSIEELTRSQQNLQFLNNELERRVAERTKSLSYSENRLSNLVANSPVALGILQTRDMIIAFANQTMLTIWGRTEEQVTGKKLMNVFPELSGQPFPNMLDDVFTTGQPISVSEIQADVGTPEGLKKYYVDFDYKPLFDPEGNVKGVMIAVIDITGSVTARKQLEESKEEEQALNEEISAANEELGASNEELLTSNEELNETQQNLRTALDNLARSEGKFRKMVQQAPVAIAVFNTSEHIIESVNNEMLLHWGKNKDVTGMPFAKAVPSLGNQPFFDIMDDVYASGKPYYGNEVNAVLEINGQMVEDYYNFIFQPLMDETGNTTSIMLVSNKVTGQVKAKQELKRSEETMRLAVNAAKLGTWNIHPETRALQYNSALAHIFGYEGEEPMTYQQAMAQVTEDYRTTILAEIDVAMASGGDYDFTYSQNRFNDGKLIWLRSLGRISSDRNGKYNIFSGIVMDISEQKADEQRKNDFIGMVSHELKTPLTSLSAYVQMLHARAQKSDDAFSSGALEKVNTQVRKMSTMINGFLNVSRLESGKIYLDKHNFRLDELIVELIDESKLTVNSHPIDLLPCVPVYIDGDRDKIGSVISNLISNAVKYSPKGRPIQIVCELTGNMIMISVKD